MKVLKEDILNILSTVMDPDLKRDLVSLNMVKDIKIEGGEITISIELTTPACPLKEKIRHDCESAIKKKIGDEHTINIQMGSKVTTQRQSDTILKGVKNIIAVASGKGGVGKSTITANLAVALAQAGAKVGLIDADIFGPSIPVMFNCENERPEIKVVDGKNFIKPLEQFGVKLISIGFLAPTDSAVVWRGPMASSALKQFLSDTIWGELDYLFIDLPPGTSDIHLTLVQSVAVTGVVIVTTPQKIALLDATKGLAMFKQPAINVPIIGIVENMAYFSPEGFPNNKYHIFGKEGGKKLSEKYEVPFLGQIPLIQTIRESGDSGLPAVMKEGEVGKLFVELSESLARQIAIRNANLDTTKRVIKTK